MNLPAMQALVEETFQTHAIPNFPIPRVVINNRLRALAGRAFYSRRTIELAGWMLAAPDAKQRNTLLHECAHHLAGAGNHHNATWRRWAVAVGIAPERCYDSETAQYAPPKTKRVFFRCAAGCEVRLTRRPRRDYSYSCYKCTTHSLPFERVE